jgi:hypothetical protein
MARSRPLPATKDKGFRNQGQLSDESCWPSVGSKRELPRTAFLLIDLSCRDLTFPCDNDNQTAEPNDRIFLHRDN